MSDEITSSGLFLHSVGPMPTGINHHWKPRVRRRADGRKYIQIDLSDEGIAYRSQVQEATRTYLEAHRATQARLDYAYCNGDGLGVVAVLYFPDQRSDLDGPLKLALDALVDGLDLDDDQIGLVAAFRAIDPADPRLELWVGTLEDAAQLAIHRLQEIATTPHPNPLPQGEREQSLSALNIQHSTFSIVLPDPPSFNKVWQWRIERGESGRARPVAYLSAAYTRYKAAAKERVLHILQEKGEDGGKLAKSLAAACRGKEKVGLGIALTLSGRNGDTDNYIKPTIDAIIEALNAAAPADPAFAPLKLVNDRYITMLVALKSRTSADTPTACATLAPLPIAAEAAIAAIRDALGIEG
jgi:Holliday junction resolvase RusA-like endonuclease